MQFPPAFKKMAMQFHQDVYLIFDTEEELFEAAIRALSAAERAEVKRFLDDLLSGPFDAEEALRAWTQSAHVGPAAEDMPGFLANLRAAIDAYEAKLT